MHFISVRTQCCTAKHTSSLDAPSQQNPIQSGHPVIAHNAKFALPFSFYPHWFKSDHLYRISSLNIAFNCLTFPFQDFCRIGSQNRHIELSSFSRHFGRFRKNSPKRPGFRAKFEYFNSNLFLRKFFDSLLHIFLS